MTRTSAPIIGAIVAACAQWWSAYAQTPADPKVDEAAATRDAFWRAIDANDYAAAHAMLTPGMQALAPLEAFAKDHEWTIRDNGSVVERRVMRTTRYDNPPSAPERGIYVAFDFVARHQRADRSCGYMILHQLADGTPFRVTRTEQTYLRNDDAKASDQPDELWAQIATQFCPGWQRSWAIQPPIVAFHHSAARASRLNCSSARRA